ncbi:MAG: hypothetical protein LBQ44_11090 [Treponema sp.]|nr:hypothetical protein [Treponema sp.]
MERTAKDIKKRSKTFLFVVFVFFVVNSAGGTERKEQVPAEPLSLRPLGAEEERVLDEILRSPDFGDREKEGFRVRLKEREKKEKKEKGRPKLRDWDFSRFREITGRALRIALGAAAAGGLGVSLYFLYKRRGRLKPRTEGRSFGVPGAGPPPDPEGLLEEAAALYRRGEIRGAWALCFRAFCAAFMARRRLPPVLPPDATEYETLALLRGAGKGGEGEDLSAPFSQFVDRWVRFAYGGVEPEPGSFEASLAACRSLLVRSLP